MCAYVCVFERECATHMMIFQRGVHVGSEWMKTILCNDCTQMSA